MHAPVPSSSTLAPPTPGGRFATLLPGLLALALAAMPAPLEGAVLRVDPSGAGDHATITSAVEAAAPGDTLLLAPATYRETVLIEGKPLTLRGEAGAEATILDGEFGGRILETRLMGSPVVLEDLTFTRGARNVLEFPGNAGAAVAAFTAPLTVRRCIFRENSASGSGGAIYCTVVFVPGIGAPPRSPRQEDPRLVIEESLFEGNFAGDEGGAVFCDDTDLELRGCRFVGNRAVGGGAVLLLNGRGTLEDCTFEENRARIDGGALRHTGPGPLAVTACRFTGNEAERHGGALALAELLQATLLSTRFRDQVAGADGGSIHALRTPVDAERVTWREGSAQRGGGLFIEEAGEASFERCTWIANTAGTGPAVYLTLSPGTFHRCLFAESDAAPVRCNLAAPVSGSCNVSGSAGSSCLPVAEVRRVEPCPGDPDRLCAAPEVEGCGIVGHEETACGDPGCTTMVRPVTWGLLKAGDR